MTSTPRRGPLAGTRAILADDGPIGRSLAAIVLAATWILTWRPQVDPDVWWHLLVGEHVLAVGDVPRTEAWSWINEGGPFVAHSWLWDTLAALAYRSLGLTGTSLLAVPVSAAIIGLLWFLLGLTASRLPPLPRAGLVALAVVSALAIWAPRSQLVDLLAVLSCLTIWSIYLRHGRPRVLWLLPLVTLAWANLHGSGVLAFVAGGFALLVAVPVGERWGTWPRQPRRPLVTWAVIALAAFAVNPYGPALLTYPFDAVVASAFQPAIDEWRSPDFRELGLATMRLVISVGVLVGVGLRAQCRDPLMLLSAAGWTFLALAAVRFTLLAGPLTVLALGAALGPALATWLGRGPAGPPAARPAVQAWLPTSVAVIAIVLIVFVGTIQIGPARQDAAVNGRYPVAMLDALAPESCRGRLFQAYDWGGYLAWAQSQPIGAYGNSPNDVVVTQAALEAVTTDPRRYLDDHGVGIALVRTGSAIDRWLHEAPEWTTTVTDGSASLHVRSAQPACPT